MADSVVAVQICVARLLCPDLIIGSVVNSQALLQFQVDKEVFEQSSVGCTVTLQASEVLENGVLQCRTSLKRKAA